MPRQVACALAHLPHKHNGSHHYRSQHKIYQSYADKCRHLCEGEGDKAHHIQHQILHDGHKTIHRDSYEGQIEELLRREGIARATHIQRNKQTHKAHTHHKEPTHHTIHTTAHCTAALELFDARPLHKCKALEPLTQKDELYHFLETEIDWTNKPWSQSHKGAGLLPCLTNTNMVDLEWKNQYFEWMWEHTDETDGFICYGTEKNAPLYEYMAGGFHYIFNHEAERRPMRYPEKVIDSCLKLMSDAEGNRMMRGCNFLEIDVVYGLTRAMRQSPYRFYEGKAALEDFAEKYVNLLLSMDYEKNESFNDLHCLFGAVCYLAELQTALPGKILTTKPLKLVLDRRPFI